MKFTFFTVLIGLALTSPVVLHSQDTTSTLSATSSPGTTTDKQSFKGFNAFEVFRGLITESGALLKLDSSVGYDFNRNFGIFAGLPLYFTNSFDSPNTTRTRQASGLGDAYVGAEVFTFSNIVRYSTSVTIGFPTGNVAKGFSPGTVTADWTNHFRRSFGRITPTFSIGVGNSVGVGVGAVRSSELIDRSLTSTGTFVHMEEGAEFDLTRSIYLGGSGYHILPVNDDQPRDVTQETIIVRENGLDAWLGYEPNRVIRTEIGYSRSATFAQNSVSFKIALNVGRALWSRTKKENRD